MLLNKGLDLTFMLTTALGSKIGDIQFAKVLTDGNLLVTCANKEQVEKALKLKEVGEKQGDKHREGGNTKWWWMQRSDHRSGTECEYGGT